MANSPCPIVRPRLCLVSAPDWTGAPRLLVTESSYDGTSEPNGLEHSLAVARPGHYTANDA